MDRDNGQQVPLPGCMIGPSEPCDAFQRQTARIAELEAELAAGRAWREAAEAELARMIAARNRDHQQALANGVAAATEREQRKAAEVLLSWLAMRGKWGNEERDAVAAHFARYEKAPT